VIAFLLTGVMVCALALVAFCAGAETGFLSIRRGRLLHLARSGGQRATILQAACQNLGRTMTALLVGNNFASVTYSSASAALSSVLFADMPGMRAVWSASAAFVVIRKGGGAEAIQSKYNKQSQVYRNQGFTISSDSGFEYLKTGAN